MRLDRPAQIMPQSLSSWIFFKRSLLWAPVIVGPIWAIIAVIGSQLAIWAVPDYVDPFFYNLPKVFIFGILYLTVFPMLVCGVPYYIFIFKILKWRQDKDIRETWRIAWTLPILFASFFLLVPVFLSVATLFWPIPGAAGLYWFPVIVLVYGGIYTITMHALYGIFRNRKWIES